VTVVRMSVSGAGNPVLRGAGPPDAAMLAEFAARTFRESFAADNTREDMQAHLAASFSEERQRAEIADPNLNTLIVHDDTGRWMAFAQLRVGKLAAGVPSERSIEIWRFYVDKPWHGRGIATLLMDAVKERARWHGATNLWLGVWERNARAQAFYRKHGFEKVGSQVFVVGSDPQTDHVMSCKLA
jgi:diamine N-acetyltransferase